MLLLGSLPWSSGEEEAPLVSTAAVADFSRAAGVESQSAGAVVEERNFLE